MSANRLEGIEACMFDAYGTLFDVHAPVARVAGRLGGKADSLSRLWRQKQLEYTWLRSLMRQHVPFETVTAEALDYAFEAHGIADAGLRDELMQLYFTLDAYDDARQALGDLKAAGFTTGILSNGSPTMLAAAVESAGLATVLDHVLSVESVGIFKPDPAVYKLAVDAAGVATPGAICFVSANTWDAQAGSAYGFRVARIDRFGLKDERIPGKPDVMLKTLADLPGVVAR